MLSSHIQKWDNSQIWCKICNQGNSLGKLPVVININLYHWFSQWVHFIMICLIELNMITPIINTIIPIIIINFIQALLKRANEALQYDDTHKELDFILLRDDLIARDAHSQIIPAQLEDLFTEIQQEVRLTCISGRGRIWDLKLTF